MWMLSNPSIFPPSNAIEQASGVASAFGATDLSAGVDGIIDALDVIDGSGLGLANRLSNAHILPLLAFFVLIIVGLVVKRFVLHNFGRFFAAWCPCCITNCCRRQRSDKTKLSYFDGKLNH